MGAVGCARIKLLQMVNTRSDSLDLSWHSSIIMVANFVSASMPLFRSSSKRMPAVVKSSLVFLLDKFFCPI